MKIAGIILLCLQLTGILGTAIHSSTTGVNAFPQTFPAFLGYFSFAIVGIILLIIHYNKANKSKNNENSAKNENVEDMKKDK